VEYRQLGRTGLVVSALGFGCGAVGGLLVKGERREMLRVVARAVELGVECEKAVVDSRTHSVAQVILEEAVSRRCDLIVMGTHGRRGMSRVVLGSDAEAVLRGAPVPVMLVRLPVKS